MGEGSCYVTLDELRLTLNFHLFSWRCLWVLDLHPDAPRPGLSSSGRLFLFFFFFAFFIHVDKRSSPTAVHTSATTAARGVVALGVQHCFYPFHLWIHVCTDVCFLWTVHRAGSTPSPQAAPPACCHYRFCHSKAGSWLIVMLMR